jgi:hypothetical protein
MKYCKLITLILLVLTDFNMLFISANPLNPCYPCAIVPKFYLIKKKYLENEMVLRDKQRLSKTLNSAERNKSTIN